MTVPNVPLDLHQPEPRVPGSHPNYPDLTVDQGELYDAAEHLRIARDQAAEAAEYFRDRAAEADADGDPDRLVTGYTRQAEKAEAQVAEYGERLAAALERFRASLRDPD